ncbi:2-5A-dependent ribonuclease [Varanus komodoensis]|nr:2-5A-dependent ribonuclease [Varanus komodoensis]
MEENSTATEPQNDQLLEEEGWGPGAKPPGEGQRSGLGHLNWSFELNEAVRFGSIETVQQLLEKGAEVNAKVESGWTALHSAVKADREDVVRLLLNKGADLHARKDNGATPFIIAGITGNVKLLDLLLEKGSGINEHDSNGFTAFMEAAWYGKEEALRFLYEKGADVNMRRVVDEEKKAVNKGGATALMDAARHSYLAIVEALVTEMEADVNICDNQGRNALIYALSVKEGDEWKREKEAVAEFLLKYRIDVDKRNENGETALILAVERGSQNLVKALLEMDGIDIDAVGKDNKTALRVAVEKTNYEIVKLLCEKGARTDIGNLIQVANVAYNNDKMIALLSRYGASCRPSQPKPATFSSKRWESRLRCLWETHRPMIGKLKFFRHEDYRIGKTSQGGGVFLGLYDGKEVAVKLLPTNGENTKREKACLEKCQPSKHLVTFCGWEKDTCIYLCLTLFEKNLEEYFEMEENAAMESQEILKTIFQAVKELHDFGFGHQDLHPSNVLIDVAGNVFLADFDKSRRITDGDKDQIISEDLQALANLVLYVAMRGKIHFEDLPAQCPEDKDGCAEIEDLRTCLKTDKNFPVSEQLKNLMDHPYFWSMQRSVNTGASVALCFYYSIFLGLIAWLTQ